MWGGGLVVWAALSPLEPDASEVATADGSAMCALPAEAVQLAARLRPPTPPTRPCPPEMAHLGHSCIDRHEAHLVVVGRDGERRHPHYERPEKGVRYQARSAEGVFPQAYISQLEARRACEAAGKRLCRLEEWRAACQGAKGAHFPQGDRPAAGACNSGKNHLMSQVFGSNPFNWSPAELNSPLLNKEPGYLARTGEHASCASPEGVHDLVGNVHEWVSDKVTLGLMEKIATEGVVRHKQPWRLGNGVFVGGFYATRDEHGPGCLFTTVAHSPRYHDYSTGFRCCADASGDGARAAAD
jgi:formylglycine-generating enzyme required for sulfatase activity